VSIIILAFAIIWHGMATRKKDHEGLDPRLNLKAQADAIGALLVSNEKVNAAIWLLTTSTRDLEAECPR
jgi:hypothetical protein